MAPTVDLKPLADLYARHIATLIQKYGDVMKRHSVDALVLHTGTAKQKSAFDDQYWPLVVVPHTRHWLPLQVADCCVVIEQGKKPTLLLNTARDFWEGPPEQQSDHFWPAFDVVECKGIDAVKAHLPKASCV